jgi:hypothetical protein
MNAAQLINQTSGEVEYYTPLEIVNAARRAMGNIDLDPATSLIANARIRAENIFTQETNGLAHDWWGNVWMNHPFGREENPRWIAKLEREFNTLRIDQACCITYACTSEAWFQPLLRRPQCYLTPRTNYYLPDGTLKRGVSKGSVVTYYGTRLDAFADAFAPLGVVKIQYSGIV